MSKRHEGKQDGIVIAVQGEKIMNKARYIYVFVRDLKLT